MKNIKSGKRSVAVMGLGTFGEQIAKTLHEGGIYILAVDYDQNKVDRIAHMVSKIICADVTNDVVLKSHGIFEVDVAVVALRRHFDTTVLVTNTLKKAGVGEIMVQVDTEQEADAIRSVGATSVVFPQRDMAVRIARHIITPNLTDYLPIGKNISIIDVPVPPKYVGKTLIELDLRKKFQITVVATRSESKGKEMVTVTPSPGKPLESGTCLIIIGVNDILDTFKKEIRSE